MLYEKSKQVERMFMSDGKMSDTMQRAIIKNPTLFRRTQYFELPVTWMDLMESVSVEGNDPTFTLDEAIAECKLYRRVQIILAVAAIVDSMADAFTLGQLVETYADKCGEEDMFPQMSAFHVCDVLPDLIDNGLAVINFGANENA